MSDAATTLANMLNQHEAAILHDWIGQQTAAAGLRSGLLSRDDLHEQSRSFLIVFRQAVQQSADVGHAAFGPVRRKLEDLASARASQGYTPSETAAFVFSLKHPLFSRLRAAYAADADGLAEAVWALTSLIDALGLFTIEVYQRGRDQLIARHQEEMLELSTPVVTLWDGVLALPLIGTLDSARAQVVMENLLQKIVESGASLAVIDITGVPTVDTMTAQHLLKTIAAARLMGADCILSGIRPQIAQTMVHLGVDLGGVATKATLADAFALALRIRGLSVRRVGTAAKKAGDAAGEGSATWSESRS